MGSLIVFVRGVCALLCACGLHKLSKETDDGGWRFCTRHGCGKLED
jgi:hypothetical protein